MKRTVNTKFYEYSQNNTGGSFANSETDGICEYVIIEALNANDANARAEDIGLYFDGCENDMDCDCCGDRWYRVDESDGSDIPSVYGTPLEDVTKSLFREECFIHYLDGTISKIIFK